MMSSRSSTGEQERESITLQFVAPAPSYPSGWETRLLGNGWFRGRK